MRILLVDDDASLRRTVHACLSAASYAVDEACDGVRGSYLGQLNEYDLVITDYVMSPVDGLGLCQKLRAAGKVMPILVLSVKSNVPEKIKMFDVGIDDYLVKPFSTDELLARVRALLRRPPRTKNPVMTVGRVLIDPGRQVVRCGSNDVYLTRKEFSLLEYLARQEGRVVTRSALIEHVWNMEQDLFSNTIEAHVRNVRRKLRAADAEIIRTVPGRGYRITDE